MKQITIPNKELRLLSFQLQNFQQGFTVDQIRSLDKVVRVIDVVLSPFNSKIEELMKKSKENESNKELEKFVEEDGDKIVNCDFEDTDFVFLKEIWQKMANFRGEGIVRKAVIVIDDALKLAHDPVFSKTND